MSTDVASLRAQLKAFERDFKGKHGRDPSVTDIKAAGFADRYKQYKKLLKPAKSVPSSSQSLQSSASGARPSTPPRSVPRKTEAPTSIIPKSRAVKTQAVSSSNPFSPVKDKGKQKQVAQDRSLDRPPLPNPFATPIKAKAKTQQRASTKPLSPDPFPLIQNSQSRATSQHEAGPRNPVSRARKRLRGEPVSPSPVKEKRQRVVSHDAVLPFPDLNALSADDSDNEDQSHLDQANSSFVAASPVKAPPNGVDFKLLFDEDPSTQSSAKVIPKPNFGRSKSIRSSNGLFGSSAKRARSASTSSEDMTVADNPNSMANKAEKDSEAPRRADRKRAQANGFAFGKNNLFDPSESSEDPLKKPSSSQQPQGRTSELNFDIQSTAKRPFPSAESEKRFPLLPPSPPAGSTNNKSKPKGKLASRKKPKLGETFGDDGDEDSQDDNDVPVREWSWQRHQKADDDDTHDLVSEPDLGFDVHRRSRRMSSPGPASDDTPGEFDVNLPDDLRRMLAISKSRALDTSEQGVVHGLLYGQRAGHYDATKGGDIWDVGEIGDGTEGEDDWDAEPVPWEVGEL
ncbi:hypothetical protein DENSPDRAFT_877809 [Dentipellis sp. KUC8613]|nr:hypothetical protein DENSPDRAFT_877809 [Dentipellis sp. KUC8613]